jgi:hypothetical protein
MTRSSLQIHFVFKHVARCACVFIMSLKQQLEVGYKKIHESGLSNTFVHFAVKHQINVCCDFRVHWPTDESLNRLFHCGRTKNEPMLSLF